MMHAKYEPEDNDIVLLDDDATGSFRQCKLHPDTAQVFSFIIEQLLFVPCGSTFGSNTSPINWEPVRRAREALAQRLFSDSSLISKHKEYIDRVQFCPSPSDS
eukprot:6130629-Ditylum_brightwellii.AAC.1